MNAEKRMKTENMIVEKRVVICLTVPAILYKANL